MGMRTLTSLRIKWRAAACGLLGLLMFATSASAQLAYTPRHVSWFTGPNFHLNVCGGADTYESVRLRAMSHAAAQQGEYLRGYAAYLEATTRVRQINQEIAAQQQQAHQQQLQQQALQRAQQRIARERREEQKKAEQADRRQKNLDKRRAELEQPQAKDVLNGVALNTLWQNMGPQLDAGQVRLPQGFEFAAIELQFANGLTLDKFVATIDTDHRAVWPKALRRTEFSESRRELDQLLAKIVAQESVRKNTSSLYQEALKKCQSFDKSAGSRCARDDKESYWEVKAFFADFNRVLSVSRSESLASVERQLAYQPTDLADLRMHMQVHNLKFAPTSDDRGLVYQTLHGALMAAGPQRPVGMNFAQR